LDVSFIELSLRGDGGWWIDVGAVENDINRWVGSSLISEVFDSATSSDGAAKVGLMESDWIPHS